MFAAGDNWKIKSKKVCVLTNNIFFSSVDALGCCGNSGLVQLLVKLVILCRHCTQIKLQDNVCWFKKITGVLISFLCESVHAGFYAVFSPHISHIPLTSFILSYVLLSLSSSQCTYFLSPCIINCCYPILSLSFCHFFLSYPATSHCFGLEKCKFN